MSRCRFRCSALALRSASVGCGTAGAEGACDCAANAALAACAALASLAASLAFCAAAASLAASAALAFSALLAASSCSPLVPARAALAFLAFSAFLAAQANASVSSSVSSSTFEALPSASADAKRTSRRPSSILGFVFKSRAELSGMANALTNCTPTAVLVRSAMRSVRRSRAPTTAAARAYPTKGAPPERLLAAGPPRAATPLNEAN
mmetsp:Transcript_14178/g.31050  ORF Transcript_14178/g.31050 Transcript_14178/m.31050 type:complete len:208 (-) Transcript_14178:998-1621(-)